MSTESGNGDGARGDGEILHGVDGRYRLVNVLSEDRYGRTLLVQDQQADNEALSLKTFWSKFAAIPDFEGLLDRCVQVARTVVGEHVVRVRGAARSADGSSYLTLDPVDGETLRQRLIREDVLQPRHALQIARQLLMALATGHDKGLVHDEVATSNIFLVNAAPKDRTNPFGVDVRLMGFGFSELADREASPRAATYVSPESAEGKQVDARSDLFSVGMICCEMLLGTKAFLSAEGSGVRPLALAGNVERLRQVFQGLPTGVADVLLKALSTDREKRFASAQEFQRAIEKCPAYQETTSTPLSVEIAIVVLVLFGALSAWFGWSQYNESNARGALLAKQSSDLTAGIERIKKLESEQSEASPEAFAASGFDAGLELIGTKRLDAFALLGALSPGQSPIPGLRFLTVLARSTAAISDIADIKEPGARQQLLARARKLFEEAQELRKTFPSEARAWLAYQPVGSANPRRLEHLDRVLRELSGRLLDLEAEIAVAPAAATASETAAPSTGTRPPPPESREDAWRSILASGPEQDPRAAFDLAAQSQAGPCPQLQELAEKYRDALTRRVLNGSRLNQRALAGEVHLLSWTERLERFAPSHQWQAAKDIRLLGYARQLYHEGRTGPFPLEAVLDRAARKERDWRDVFYLRAKVLELPCVLQGKDRLGVFAQHVGEHDATFLRVENTGTSPESSCAFFVSVFDGEGNEIARREVRVLADGSRRSWDGFRIDVVHDDAEIGIYQPPPQKLPVPRQAGLRQEDLERYEAEYAGFDQESKECLVFSKGSLAIWLSPRLGLVRTVSGQALKQLVYSGPRQ